MKIDITIQTDFPTNIDVILEDVEASIVEQALEASEGNKAKAGRLLGIGYRSIRYRVDKLKLRG